MRMIDADVLLDSIKIQMLDEDYDITCVIPDIENAPTIEAEQVRHGRWLRGSAYPHHIFCSVCYATYIPNDEIPLWKSESYFNVPRNYCPYCGAKMDGGGYDGNG